MNFELIVNDLDIMMMNSSIKSLRQTYKIKAFSDIHPNLSFFYLRLGLELNDVF